MPETARLYCPDQGRMLRIRGEELTRFTLAAKRFEVEETGAPGRLFLFVRECPGNRSGLHVELAGREIGRLEPEPEREGSWRWAELPVPEGALTPGKNEFVLRAETSGCTSWTLGISCERPRGASGKSPDGGATWPEGLLFGYDFTLTGEYMARLLVDPAVEPDGPARPHFVYESPDHPRLAAMRQEFGLEAMTAGASTDLERARRVMSWWTGSWTYEKDCGPIYSPWDPFTIIPWKGESWGGGYDKPLAYCVHSASGLTLLLRAAGLAARSLVTDSADPAGTGGHFLTEVWCRELGQWTVLDPHFDAVITLSGRPASALELQPLAERGECSEMGFTPGESYGGNPRCEEAWLERWLAGRGFWELGYYERGDMAAHPELCPPEHGTSAYHATCFLWLDTEITPHRPYFPLWTRDLAALAAEPEL